MSMLKRSDIIKEILRLHKQRIYVDLKIAALERLLKTAEDSKRVLTKLGE